MDRDAFLDLHPDDPRWGHNYGSGADQLRLHYVRQGCGPTVILLHGWPGFWYDWRRVIPQLAEEADVIAPDFEGLRRLRQAGAPSDRRLHPSSPCL